MLSYQHCFHAGGPADVHKHSGLCLLLDHLMSKEKPFTVFDLYAGNGAYDLTSEPAQKLKEFRDGIEKIYAESSYPNDIVSYIKAVRNLNTGNTLNAYPGSPLFSKGFLRENDQLILNELHPSSYRALRKWKNNDKRISVHKREGMEALLGLVPPSIRRGLVFIDPSYEVKSEFTDIPSKLKIALKRWPQGIYALWYPILKDAQHDHLVKFFKEEMETESYRSEILLADPHNPSISHPGLRGSGLIVINPPWKFDQGMIVVGNWVAEKLTGNPNRHTAGWINSPASLP